MYRLIRFIKRLFRRIRHCLRFKDMWQHDFESCQKCGSNLRVIYSIDSKHWKNITEKQKKYKILCIDCMLTEAIKKKLLVTEKNFDYLALPFEKSVIVSFDFSYPDLMVIKDIKEEKC